MYHLGNKSDLPLRVTPAPAGTAVCARIKQRPEDDPTSLKLNGTGSDLPARQPQAAAHWHRDWQAQAGRGGSDEHTDFSPNFCTFIPYFFCIENLDQMLAPVQDFVLDHPIPTFLEKQYWFKQHFVVFSAKKVICVSTWKTGFIQIWPISLLPLRFKRWFLSQKWST